MLGHRCPVSASPQCPWFTWPEDFMWQSGIPPTSPGVRPLLSAGPQSCPFSPPPFAGASPSKCCCDTKTPPQPLRLRGRPALHLSFFHVRSERLLQPLKLKESEHKSPTSQNLPKKLYSSFRIPASETAVEESEAICTCGLVRSPSPILTSKGLPALRCPVPNSSLLWDSFECQFTNVWLAAIIKSFDHSTKPFLLQCI